MPHDAASLAVLLSFNLDTEHLAQVMDHSSTHATGVAQHAGEETRSTPGEPPPPNSGAWRPSRPSKQSGGIWIRRVDVNARWLDTGCSCAWHQLGASFGVSDGIPLLGSRRCVT
jgi:hypothetical protein